MELAVTPGAGWGTAVALSLCRHTQARRGEGERAPLCAFLDPSESLHAPGVARAGIDLTRLLVARPEPTELGRIAVRLAESRIFSLIVVDLVGVPHAPLELALGPWVRVVRRLSLAIAHSRTSLVLLTDQTAARSIPLPVTERFELTRATPRELVVRVSKDQRGRLEGPRRVAWSRRTRSEPTPSRVA